MQANRHLKRNHSRIASSDSEAENSNHDDDEIANPDTNPSSRQDEASLVNNSSHENEEGPALSQGSDGSMVDNLISLAPAQAQIVGDVSEYYANDFATVSERLRNVQPMQSFDVPMEICDDFHNVIFPELRHIVTMDGVSKSFVTIPPKDSSHLVQPYEGACFTFVDR